MAWQLLHERKITRMSKGADEKSDTHMGIRGTLKHARSRMRSLFCVAKEARIDSFNTALVSFRIQFKIAVLTYHALHKNGPEYIGELIGLHRSVRTLRSGDSLDLVVPHTRKVTFGDRAFAAFAPTLWNSLPLSVRQSETSSSFCSSLKTHLFHLAFPPSQNWILCDGKRLCTFDGNGAIEITHIIIIIIIILGFGFS